MSKVEFPRKQGRPIDDASFSDFEKRVALRPAVSQARVPTPAEIQHIAADLKKVAEETRALREELEKRIKGKAINSTLIVALPQFSPPTGGVF
jgi:hypothetical protein